MKLLVCCILLVLNISNLYAESTIRHITPENKYDKRNIYYIKLLKLALKKTEKTYGQVNVEAVNIKMTQKRAIIFIIENKVLDVIWTMTSLEREKQMQAVYIPLSKGLLGCRALLINKKHKSKFESIKSFNQFLKYTAGQGHDWPDTKILKSNGVRLETSPNYKGLFKMLIEERFDYFPRSVYEIWDEYKSYKSQDIVIDEHLLLLYPSPSYFFVSKKNIRLAKRLEIGLKKAIDDGSFNKLFNSFSKEKNVFKILKNKKIFKLKNPYMSPLTPIKDKKLWYFSFD